MMLAQKPRRDDEGPNESAGKYAPSLQGSQAENFARMLGVVAPVDQEIKQLRAHDSCENHRNAKIPCVLSLNALSGGVPNADPKPHQNASGN